MRYDIDAREITFNDRLTVAGHADNLYDLGREHRAMAQALIDAVRCCGEFPECSHVLAWVEARDAARAANSRRGGEMKPAEIERALEIGPPDFLLGEDFDAENGAGAADELRRLAEENSRG